MKSIFGEAVCSLCSVIADKQMVFHWDHYTIQLVCFFWKCNHMVVWLLVTVKEASAFLQSISQERTTMICLQPFCLLEMFNFLANNSSCTLGKQPLLACLFGRRGSHVDLTWISNDNSYQEKKMKGRGGEAGWSREETREEDPIYFE